MKCQDARRILSLDLDGELSTETAFALARHLEECRACADRFAAERDLERRLRQVLVPSAEPTAGLWQSIEERLRSRPRRAIRVAAAAGGALLLALLIWLARAPEPESLARVLATMHAKVLDGVELPQAAFEDPVAARDFFRERLPFPVQVPGGIDVRGGRVCSVHGKKLALLFARDAGQAVSLFTLPAAMLDLFPAEARGLAADDVVVSGHGAGTVVLRKTDGVLLAAAGELSPEHLRELLTFHR